MGKYFPLTRTRTVTVEIPVGTGDRDVSYNDSFNISEQLAGTLGPVQTQDSIDVADMLVVQEFTLQDSVLPLDDLGEISGLVINDSFNANDQLAGNLGPVRAPDTFVALDDPVLGPLVLQDSLTTSDVSSVALDATAIDSVTISDRLGQITRFDNEEFFTADKYGEQFTQVDDSVSVSDAFDADSVDVRDSLDVSIVSSADITAFNQESFDCADRLMIGGAVVPDSLSMADARRNATVSNARLWPNTVVSNTGFTTPANITDTNEATATTISATQSGGLVGGSSVTVNGNIQISAPDMTFSPDATTNSVQLQIGYTTTASGGLQTGNSVNVAIDYSLNDGSTWTNIATATVAATTANPTLNITATTAQLNQLRFRAVGSVVSGTTLIVGGANQQFQFRYARVQFNAVQVL